MKHLLIAILFAAASFQPASADDMADRKAIEQAALDYIESQHKPDPSRMDRALHGDMKKRTYWEKTDGTEYVMETSRDTMLWVAENYNKDGKAFPNPPRKDIEILALDGRIASVKLTADDWIDYLHLTKGNEGEWKIINVLWQFHDQSQQVDRK
ncbi:nuclear transport factor 2 family protein [Kordiimonas lacus]|uniref:Putative lumazine-binding n=1 Tax=Kordiimonas lacus TaxID=637679 RepID=A0A1G6ZMG8_9PROT|nr:nuclear transport factor 2 family protein [Kordiimonas lacus]SDE03858.1 Putative lumazine-binding [Kordiimonas lacus]